MMTAEELQKLIQENGDKVVQVRLDLMQLAHLLRGHGMFFNLGGYLANMTVGQKEVLGKTSDEILSLLLEEMNKVNMPAHFQQALEGKSGEQPKQP